jgi:hypothetical protein
MPWDGDHVQSLLGLFGKMIIVRAGQCPHLDSIDYWAISDMFDEVEEGSDIPWYEMEFQTVDHGEDYAENGHQHQHETIVRAVKRIAPGEVYF